MDGNNLEAEFSPGALSHFKVGHPHTTNDIPQMKSAGLQPPFYLGGSQISYYLKQKNPNVPEVEPYQIKISKTLEIMMKHKNNM